MHIPPFDRPGRFYKGNLHLHSTRSDGKLEPGAVLAAYRERDYDFVALTDHFLPRFDFPLVDTRQWRTPEFTTIFGAELHARSMENGEPWHILAVGLPLDFAPNAQDETGPQLVTRAAAAGAFVAIAHPAWNALSEADASRLFYLLRVLREQGLGMVYISHRLREVMSITDRIVCLRDGRIAGELPTREGRQVSGAPAPCPGRRWRESTHAPAEFTSSSRTPSSGGAPPGRRPRPP